MGLTSSPERRLRVQAMWRSLEEIPWNEQSQQDLPDLKECQLQQPKSSGVLSSSKKRKCVVTITESGVESRGVARVGIGLHSGRHLQMKEMKK
ncbi:hypothetical protein SAICODRAFT_163387 [Saitoella complicata NRRL Y-17804]|uniref:uncharacterized protein n=1 Tax=Saitoella complicata (strain BCRC 22490 / CBS 7301 / JCM 7358 / NBRC 10748 / NRRL Y-17804) TaxID=698492 RepID=UPI0008682054|nr:uncharacterized protein SAICODRAFT_163387 [Saitoella complicata NRRL Y-17804]ODQ50807.1 hypothetical protein SAICODRAFT_163387 [Saitoella complicata NRRL Y-17804]